MPAWGAAGDGDCNQDSWKLVLFIRQLPGMSKQEAEQNGEAKSENAPRV
jgi:hypothetical protein